VEDRAIDRKRAVEAVRLWLRRGAIQYTFQSDMALLHLARQGNTDAFDELVLRYRNRVYGLACDLLVDEEQIVDAVREAFVSAYRDLIGRTSASDPGACFHRHAVRAVVSRAALQRIGSA
jgi:RNA polymerase sigma-70 factor (ECF subfamily)